MNDSQIPVVTPSRSHAADPIIKTIVVAASPERAFQVFTEEMSAWWPLATSHIGKADAKSVVIEPFVGGRWFERGIDGSECDWGHVRTWDPPRQLVLSWEISIQSPVHPPGDPLLGEVWDSENCTSLGEWGHDPSIQTEVEVRFTPDGASTRVDLEHRLLHYYGVNTTKMRGIFDSERGWTRMLSAFAARASATC
jgi:uncharacterized protein YndB with AHSA1/START domain